MNWLHFERNSTRDKAAARIRQKIRIDVKLVLPRSEWLHKFHSTYVHCTLHPQGWRVHYTHASAEASYDRSRSSAVWFIHRPIKLPVKLPLLGAYIRAVMTNMYTWCLLPRRLFTPKHVCMSARYSDNNTDSWKYKSFWLVCITQLMC